MKRGAPRAGCGEVTVVTRRGNWWESTLHYDNVFPASAQPEPVCKLIIHIAAQPVPRAIKESAPINRRGLYRAIKQFIW